MAQQSAIEVLLAQARAGLDGVEREHLVDEVASGAILVDIRPVEQRQRDGELTGAISGKQVPFGPMREPLEPLGPRKSDKLP
jgi:hypothetical protein